MASGDPKYGTYQFHPYYPARPEGYYRGFSPTPAPPTVELLTVEHYGRLIKLLNILAERLTAIEEAVGSGS